MKMKLFLKFATLGVLLFYTLVIVGIGYGSYLCFDGIMAITGIWQVVRIVGGILLLLIDIIVFVIWLYIAVCLFKGLPEKSIAITEEEEKQFEQFIKNNKEETKK